MIMEQPSNLMVSDEMNAYLLLGFTVLMMSHNVSEGNYGDACCSILFPKTLD